MAREIHLESGHENDPALYDNINRHRENIKSIVKEGYVKIGKDTHQAKKGERGDTLLRSIKTILREVLGNTYNPRRLTSKEIEKLDAAYKKSKNYSSRIREHINVAGTYSTKRRAPA